MNLQYLCLGGSLMINIIYSEFVKLKKSYILIIALFSGVLMPGVVFMTDMLRRHNELVRLTERVRFLEDSIVDIDRMSALLIYSIIFSLIAAYIFSREYTDKTANILYAYPSGRIKIFFGKLITIYSLIVFVYLIQILITYLGLYIEWGVLPSVKFISTDIKVNIYSMLLQFLLMPIPILIANITRNIIVPIVYGLLGDVTVGLLLGGGASIYSQFCPLTLPILPFYYYHKGDPIDIVIVIGSAVITFSVFMSLCICHYSKVDID